MRQLFAPRIPNLDGKFLDATTCMYTLTDNGHFLIDFHPQHGDVVVLSPCSCHGFKFASVLGEVAAQLCVDGKTEHDIAQFSLAQHSGRTSRM